VVFIYGYLLFYVTTFAAVCKIRGTQIRACQALRFPGLHLSGDEFGHATAFALSASFRIEGVGGRYEALRQCKGRKDESETQKLFEILCALGSFASWQSFPLSPDGFSLFEQHRVLESIPVMSEPRSQR